MKKKEMCILALMLFVMMGCAPHSSVQRSEKETKTELRVYTGINQGGITENTDMEASEELQVDGFTGATRLGVHLGARAVVPLGRQQLETGLEGIYHNQTFTYEDPLNGLEGERQIRNFQLMVPLTYNIGIFRKHAAEGVLNLKLGWTLQYNIPVIRDQGLSLPDYTIRRFSNGPVLGLETRSFPLGEGMGLALNFELYRGSQIYQDLYNQSSFEMPGSSYFKAGVVFRLDP